MKELATGMYKILGEGAFEYLAKAQAEERKGKKILHFEIGQPDFPTPKHIKQTAYEEIKGNYTGYVSATGILELKQAIQDEIEQTRGYRPSIEQILVLPGAKPGIFFTMLGLVNPGDEVMYPDPGFPTYGSVTKYLQAVDVPIALKEKNQFKLDPTDVENSITPKTKLIILNSPQNTLQQNQILILIVIPKTRVSIYEPEQKRYPAKPQGKAQADCGSPNQVSAFRRK